ncbi:MAG: heat-shock protein Hsp20 [Candidatus Portnoybacteria bacterium CG10_big_fil_rev_8_21_14_0_10_44_7]|uniref:Heat-shock protein Hsp20 n=1 Tax=Candidatus Portnoybacteria bacterium CG10_big_fil_rev_8_21_14_0_10_44_7 TaxID=1974816 RepID=A0A2M8KIM6_9BACT|nr:MAG: heat-shock protein Hsp20 [Candidatus Portnoybacteria bacterium CG10_big_fil_rev_8_21_14_0_10_44_7]
MSAKKPSLLERLTGTMENEEEVAKIKNLNSEISEEQEDESEELPPETMAEQSSKEQWLPDSDGQLTIDVYQTENDIVIKSTIAGVNPDDLDITITNDMVTIKGTRAKDEEIKNENYYYQECYWGAFSRSIILPVDVEAERAEAAMKNGILTIRLPKIEKVKTRKIKVKTT